MTTKRLSDDDVRLIRQLDQEREKHRKIANSLTRKQIGLKFGISSSRVFDICTGLSYKHVED